MSSAQFEKDHRLLIYTRHRRKLKHKAIEYKGGACQICGYSKSIYALQFHHTDRSAKEFGFASATRSSWEHIRKELDKTVLLCANCHAELHGNERDARLQELEDRVGIRAVDGMRACLVCACRFIPVGIERRCSQCVPKRSMRLDPSVVENLLEKGLTQIRIAEELGASVQGVHKFCARRGLKRVPVDRWPGVDLLRRLVWEQPMIEVAKVLGVSDVALKKHCVKNNITLPPKGFWLKGRSR